MINNEIDELEDFDLDETFVEYQVWLMGYDENDQITDFEYLIDSFNSEKEAHKCMEYFRSQNRIKQIKNVDPDFKIPKNVKRLTISIEATVEVEDIDTNIDTVYEGDVE